MAVSDHVNLEQFMEGLQRRNPGEHEFHQAVYEVAANVFDYIDDKEIYHEQQILRRGLRRAEGEKRRGNGDNERRNHAHDRFSRRRN